MILIATYVDDILITVKDQDAITELGEKLASWTEKLGQLLLGNKIQPK